MSHVTMYSTIVHMSHMYHMWEGTKIHVHYTLCTHINMIHSFVCIIHMTYIIYIYNICVGSMYKYIIIRVYMNIMYIYILYVIVCIYLYIYSTAVFTLRVHVLHVVHMCTCTQITVLATGNFRQGR